MNDESMTKEQLLDELKAARKEIDRFRKAGCFSHKYASKMEPGGKNVTLNRSL